MAYLVRLIANFNATLFFGIIYIETRDKVQAQINPRTFFLMFCVGIPMQFILVSNFIYHYQWLSLKKEVKDGMYHPAANAIASWIVQIPMMFILALSSLIPMFALGDLAWESFGIVLVLYAVTFWAFEGLAQAFSCFPNVIYGLFMFLNIYFMAFLFCGMFVDPEDVVWPIRVFCYFLPLGDSAVLHVRALAPHGQPQGRHLLHTRRRAPPGRRVHRAGLLLLQRGGPQRRGLLRRDWRPDPGVALRAVHHLRG